MALDPRLEFFLDDVGQGLRPLPASERLAILNKLKGEIDERLGRVPPMTAEEILKELGGASAYANRFRRERGYGPAAANRMRPGLKWLLIFVVFFFLMIPLSIGLLVWKLFPLISIRDDGRSVKIFGGMVDLEDFDGDFNFHFGDGEGLGWGAGSSDTNNKVEGELPIEAGSSPLIDVKFKNGKFHFASARDSKLTWSCRMGRDRINLPTSQSKESIELDLSAAGGANCELQIPRGLAVKANGSNGTVELHEPQFSADIKMTNGSVFIAPSVDEKYVYNLKVRRGRVDDFRDDSDAKALRINVSLTNGKIERR